MRRGRINEDKRKRKEKIEFTRNPIPVIFQQTDSFIKYHHFTKLICYIGQRTISIKKIRQKKRYLQDIQLDNAITRCIMLAVN